MKTINWTIIRIYSNCWSSGGGKGKLLFWLFRPGFRGRREIIRISYWLILGGVGISLFAHHVALLLGRLHKPCLGERIPCFIPPLRPKTYHPLPTRYSPSLWKTSFQVYVSPSPSSKSLFRRSFGPHQNIWRFQTYVWNLNFLALLSLLELSLLLATWWGFLAPTVTSQSAATFSHCIHPRMEFTDAYFTIFQIKQNGLELNLPPISPLPT